jgi:hypothetical protein
MRGLGFAMARVVAPALALVVGLALTGSVLAAGGPGPEDPPVRFDPTIDLDAPVLELIGHKVLLPGEIACKQAGFGRVSGEILQEVDGTQVTGSASVERSCAAGHSRRVLLRIRPENGDQLVAGPATVFLEFEYDTVPDANGTHHPGNMFGILFADLEPAG